MGYTLLEQEYRHLTVGLLLNNATRERTNFYGNLLPTRRKRVKIIVHAETPNATTLNMCAGPTINDLAYVRYPRPFV